MREVFVLEDVLNALITLEENGNLLYLDLSKNAKDLETQKIFAFLAQQELNHKEIYQKFKNELTVKTDISEEYNEYMIAMIKANIQITNQEIASYEYMEALDIGIQLEKDTILFLNELRDIVGDSVNIITRLIEEEKKHLKILFNLKSIRGLYV